MATTKDTAEFILNALGNQTIFSVKPMFGEYALYANHKTVGFICDNTLFIKIVPSGQALSHCDQGPAYPGSKPYYIIEDDLLTDPSFPTTLINIADSIPAKKKKAES